MACGHITGLGRKPPTTHHLGDLSAPTGSPKWSPPTTNPHPCKATLLVHVLPAAQEETPSPAVHLKKALTSKRKKRTTGRLILVETDDLVNGRIYGRMSKAGEGRGRGGGGKGKSLHSDVRSHGIHKTRQSH